MAKRKKIDQKKIDHYTHVDKKRPNNPPVGLVTRETEPPVAESETYAYDYHIDPALQFDTTGNFVESLMDRGMEALELPADATPEELQAAIASAKQALEQLQKARSPYLNWTGKAERTSFEVPTVSLHVHERIDPKTIIDAVRDHVPQPVEQQPLLPMFERPEENPPLRDALDFYKHPHGWANRLIAGDSLLVMNSLLEKEGIAGKVQMVYFDPPYGIRYGSNFQPFVNKRDVTDRKDEDLTQEPEMLKAFRDTWKLNIHSYLTYLRDRLRLAHEMLSETGALFLQIGQDNVHHARELCQEIFGSSNLVAQIPFVTTSGSTREHLAAVHDYVLFFAKNKERLKYRRLLLLKDLATAVQGPYSWLELEDGTRRRLTPEEKRNPKAIEPKARVFRFDNLQSQAVGREKGEGAACWFPVEFEGRTYRPGAKSRWKTNEEGMERLRLARRLGATKSGLYYIRYFDDFRAYPLSNFWDDTTTAGFSSDKRYVVETNTKVIQRCMLMVTDPGDLVFDPTCGSGTTARVAEQWGRRWITCDTSRIAITLAKQRLMTEIFDYYRLESPGEGISKGFVYNSLSHIMLGAIATNPELKQGMTRIEIDSIVRRHAKQPKVFDDPDVDSSKARVTGPFTVEAVPSVNVRPIDEAPADNPGDVSAARNGETLRQEEWREELVRTGIRGKSGQKIEFARLEPQPGLRSLHAIGETLDEKPKRIAVSFGPAYAPLEQRQVEQAWEEARTTSPSPEILIFAAFHFDPEAAKDIDALTPQKTGMVFLRSQMNTDLLTEDLKKKRSSNESFWLIGQPDVMLRKVHKGESAGQLEVEVLGYDYYNPITGAVESGDTSKIAMWMLDTDYDGRSMYPRQVFFPMAGPKDGWARLAQSLKAEIDPDLIDAYTGTVSLPFKMGKNRRIAVKIIDDRGIESLNVLTLS